MTTQELERRAEEAILQARMLSAEARRLRQIGRKRPTDIALLPLIYWFGQNTDGGGPTTGSMKFG